MKLNRTLGLLLVATATVGAGAAFAAADTTSTTTAASTTAPAPGGRHWQRRHGGMLVGLMLRAARQLNLTPDQQASIKSLLSSARSQHQAAAAGNAQVNWTVLANPGDPDYATALQSAKSAAAARFQNEVDLQNQIYNVLTPEQKAKLPQVLADMKSKAEQRRAAWLEQHQSASEAATGSN